MFCPITHSFYHISVITAMPYQTWRSCLMIKEWGKSSWRRDKNIIEEHFIVSSEMLATFRCQCYWILLIYGSLQKPAEDVPFSFSTRRLLKILGTFLVLVVCDVEIIIIIMITTIIIISLFPWNSYSCIGNKNSNRM